MVQPAKNYESQYTEGRKLGQGNSGVVYLTTHKQENKEYVAKKMEFGQLPADLIKRLNEVKLSRSMEHSNIVPYKDFFVQHDKGLVILIMEYCKCKIPV